MKTDEQLPSNFSNNNVSYLHMVDVRKLNKVTIKYKKYHKTWHLLLWFYYWLKYRKYKRIDKKWNKYFQKQFKTAKRTLIDRLLKRGEEDESI